jgi:hypothetical protein
LNWIKWSNRINLHSCRLRRVGVQKQICSSNMRTWLGLLRKRGRGKLTQWDYDPGSMKTRSAQQASTNFESAVGAELLPFQRRTRQAERRQSKACPQHSAQHSWPKMWVPNCYSKWTKRKPATKIDLFVAQTRHCQNYKHMTLRRRWKLKGMSGSTQGKSRFQEASARMLLALEVHSNDHNVLLHQPHLARHTAPH